jgi:hypothetical protein
VIWGAGGQAAHEAEDELCCQLGIASQHQRLKYAGGGIMPKQLLKVQLLL